MLRKLTGFIAGTWGDRRDTWELLAVLFALALYLAIEIHAISLGNFASQDYQRHCESIRLASQHPWATLMLPLTPGHGMTTLYHVIGGGIYRILGEAWTWRAVAVLNMLANALAFFLIWRILRKVIASSRVRVAGFLFLLFLPLTIITTAVVATDAAATWLFVVMVWLLMCLVERLQKGRGITDILVLHALVLVVAFLNKLNYGICVVGTLGVLLFLWRYGLLFGKKLVAALLIVFVLPLAFLIAFQNVYTKQKTPFIVNPNSLPLWARMDPRRLIVPSPYDPEILAAPYFHEPEFVLYKIQPKAQTTNYFSYPALVHLGTFTDMLNAYQPIVYASNDPRVVDEYYTRIRPLENRDRMRLAIKSALLFSVAGIFAVLFWIVASIRNFWKRQGVGDMPVVIMLALGLPVFLGMALVLPYTRWTYATGCWMPRFILPVLIFFFATIFIAFDRYVAARLSWARWALLLLVVYQSVLHVSFLWVPVVRM